MGYFSFLTQDTKKSIANIHSGRKTFIVYMKDNEGNTYTEKNYQGYGVFGGVDFFELLAKMNGKKTREQGIELFYNDKGEKFISPNLFAKKDGEFNGKPPRRCPDQGYFY